MAQVYEPLPPDAIEILDRGETVQIAKRMRMFGKKIEDEALVRKAINGRCEADDLEIVGSVEIIQHPDQTIEAKANVRRKK